MKLLRCIALPIGLSLGILLPLRGAAEDKPIRLRVGVLQPAAPSARTAAAPAATTQPAVSGLYLVQLQDRLRPEWREALAGVGVELLRFVPEDAFVAQLEGVRLETVRALPFVRWVGAYEPGLRLHPTLSRWLATSPPGRPVEVKVLLSPRANAIEIAQLEKAFSTVTRARSVRFGAILTGRLAVIQLARLVRSPLVLWVERAPRMKLFDEVATDIVAGDDGLPGTPSGVQELGFDGRGVTVAVADSGLDTGDVDDMHPDLAGRVDALFQYGGLEDASDEHSHGTHVAGIVAGNAATGEVDDAGYFYGLGVAPAAHIVVQRIFDGAGEYYAPESFGQLTRDAVRNGAAVGSNSWGDDTQGQYDLSAHEFDALVRDADPSTPGEQPYVLEFSAGNSGPGAYTIGSPAVAKNVIATGACENNRFEFPIYGDGQEVMADFSSRGPCEDGRIKPDVVAPGTWIASLRSQYASDENAWSPISGYYLYQGGTSQAGPHASGAAAVFIQYYRDTHGGLTPSPALVKAALINSAVDMGLGWRPDEEGEPEPVGGTDPVPNNDEGWGRIDLVNLLASDRRYEFVEQGPGLRTSQILEKRVAASPNAPLKVTLVYTDVPGLPAAIPALVNDLDLEVIAPDGRLYRGNAFLAGSSVPDTVAADRLNNVEAVHLEEPLPGEYLVRVVAFRVVEDIHGRTNTPPEQDFALVISGDLPGPGEGVVYFDRGSYRIPASVGLNLIDSQLAGQPTVGVRISSDTEAAGEAVLLAARGVAGLFTNTIALATGPAVAGDGRLQVAHNDLLTLSYQDADPPAERTATARVDLVPPQITEVTAAGRFGRTTVRWTTDEPATSLVVFGLPGNLTQASSNSLLTLTHTVELPPLEANVTYHFYVASADAAGNVATNDNLGRFYSFVAPQAATALLVYSPEYTWDSLFGSLFGEFPGRDEWTGPLDQLGVSYEIWDTLDRGKAPSAADLAPFRVVLWRPEELGDVPTGLREALTTYLGQGGSLFVCSFDLLSRLSLPSDVAFRSNVLHVATFEVDQGADTITASPADPVGAGIDTYLDYSLFPDASIVGLNWPDGPDALELAPDAVEVFRNDAGNPVGLRFPRTGSDSPSRVVFCSFPLEAVPLEGDPPNNRLTFLGNALEFLVPGLRGLARIAFDRSAYTVPGAATIEVTDVQRAGAGQVPLIVQSTTDTAPKTLTLVETVRRGVFRGLIGLAPTNAPAGPRDELEAQHGDLVWATYVDTTERDVVASVGVDTLPPVISDVSVEPAYNEAVVSWATSKRADALVQFGTGDIGLPINRTAYAAGQATEHAVQLAGLLPDTVYRFQVVSRDEAGNTATDDRDGVFHTFRTLKPLAAPWYDDLEHGRAGWAVYNDEAAVDEETGENLLNSGWRHGQPRNPQGIAPHGGQNCWATNLEGDDVDLAISDLYSPAIDLTGVTRATLSFWQYYDFTERSELLDLEFGQVAVSTDNGATWSAVYATEGEFSFDWEEIELDLSKYAGQVVRIRWNYQMISFEPYPRPGWLIDDVRVEADRTPIGTLVLTSNLEQAGFNLAGPLTQSGAGSYLRLSNAPVGEYTITWTPVAYHLTPAPETKVLTAEQTLTFNGQYTFPDGNANGISDLYEQDQLGQVAPVHPPATDTDGDGASDYAEFIAGTHAGRADSSLAVTQVALQPNRTVRVTWQAVPGHLYRLELSTNLTEWLPASEWIRADASTATAALPPLTGSNEFLFRVEVRP